MDAGQEFGSYRLVSRIGAGGMGEVWKAEDPRLRRTVAIKILPADSASSSESNARFMREARTAAQLYHPNIATIHSIEEHEGRLFIVMEYVEGEPLSRAIRSGRLGEAEVAFIGKGVAEALAEAHANGIVHRDIKPDNVIIAGQRVKVLDFGIAKKAAGELDKTANDSAATDFHTQRGVILGTVQYMSPEQAMGKDLDGRSDLFSLGVLLYEASTGRLPFKGETVTDTLTRIIRDEAPDLKVSHPNLSPALVDTIMKCLAKDREQRFKNASEVAKALDEIFAASRTGRKSTVSGNLPTAVSVRQEVSTAELTDGGTAAATRDRTVARGQGPWPWIFATVLLVAGSVAGTAWYLTRVLRPSAPVTETELPTPPEGSLVATVTDEGPPVRTSEPLPPAESVAVEEPPPVAVADPGRDRFDGPGQRSMPPEPSPNASDAEKADALTRRGFWLIGHGREGEGVEALHRAITLEPSMARAWLPIGVVALRRGRHEDAAKAFAAALRQAESLGRREVTFASFGSAVAGGDRDQMNEYCRTAPFDREFGELRRLARAAGAECVVPLSTGAPPGRGPGPPGGVPPSPGP